MTAEVLGAPETLTARCARLVPGFWGYEDALIIADGERSEMFPPLVETETAQWFAVQLARAVLRGSAIFGSVDPESLQGQELTALIAELTPVSEQEQEERQAKGEVAGDKRSLVSLLLEYHDQSVRDGAYVLAAVEEEGSDRSDLNTVIAEDRVVKFVASNEAALEKEQEESNADYEKLISTGVSLYARLMVAQRANIDIVLMDEAKSALRVYLATQGEIDGSGGEREFIEKLRRERRETVSDTVSPDSLLMIFLKAYEEDVRDRAKDLTEKASWSGLQSGLAVSERKAKISAMTAAALNIESRESQMSKTDITNRAVGLYCLCAHLQRAGVSVILRDPEGNTELLDPVWEL